MTKFVVVFYAFILLYYEEKNFYRLSLKSKMFSILYIKHNKTQKNSKILLQYLSFQKFGRNVWSILKIQRP